MTRSTAGIATLEDLRTHLQWAIELEHSTLPPYLCALYSLDPARNAEAAEVIGTVFAEEMLHLLLAANLLNAVGGNPVLDAPHLLPSYPHPLPHSDRSVQVGLAPFGPEALEVFLRIEQPGRGDARAQADGYTTIGQFYAAIEEGLRGLCASLGEEAVFSGDPVRQVRDFHLSRGGGRVIAVQDLASALEALGEIVEQGEGAATEVWDGDRDVFHPEREEVAHYYRFMELKEGRRFRAGDTPQSGPTGEALAVDFGGVLPMRPNPRTADHAPGSPVRLAQEEFNHTYCVLLHLLEEAFTGSPSLLGVATGMMYAVRAQAGALMRMPSGDGRTTAGPTFEYVPKERRRHRTGDARRIAVLENGPYVVYGQVPLRRKHKVVSNPEKQSLTWETGSDLATEETYALCRCGRSSSKPFCDGSHAVAGPGREPFDGTETADPRPYAELAHIHDGEGISAHRVGELCVHAAFCIGRTRPIAKMLDDSGDPDVRSHIMGLIDHCPSGSYTYSIDRTSELIEPDLPQAISVLEEEDGIASSLWVTGRVPVERADGVPLESRNRVALCRCGQSANKPLCDGTHRHVGFRE